MAYRKIDTSTWNRKSAYQYFSTFDNPCYGMTVEMDITTLYTLTKRNNESIFINMMYLLCRGLNDIEEMRLRIVEGEIALFDVINPAYTVMTKLGVFENCYSKMDDDHREFYRLAQEEIEANKDKKMIKDAYNDSPLFDQFYISCVPWLNFASMTHPLPSRNPSSSSVPRVCWGKFYDVGDRKKVMLNITVSHALVDGLPLSKTFLKIQEYFDKAEEYIEQ